MLTTPEVAKVYSNFRSMKSQSQGVQERRGACQLYPRVKRGACRTRDWDVLQDGLKPLRALEMARAYDMASCGASDTVFINVSFASSQRCARCSQVHRALKLAQLIAALPRSLRDSHLLPSAHAGEGPAAREGPAHAPARRYSSDHSPTARAPSASPSRIHTDCRSRSRCRRNARAPA